MHAVIMSGGKQYTVAEGQVLKLEKLPHEVGQEFAFEQVLLVGSGDNVQLGAPFLKGASVTAEVLSQGRHKKVHIIKFRRRKHYMRRQGHRQDYTEIKVTGITA